MQRPDSRPAASPLLAASWRGTGRARAERACLAVQEASSAPAGGAAFPSEPAGSRFRRGAARAATLPLAWGLKGEGMDEVPGAQGCLAREAAA